MTKTNIDLPDNLSPELHKFLTDRFSAIESEVSLLREEVDTLREKARKKAKKEFTDEMKLIELKENFLRSEPYNRTDPFNDWELVFWASYVLSRTPRHEKLDSISEVAKRGHRIKALVNHFYAYYSQLQANTGESNEELANAWARKRVKDFLEYVLTTYEDIPTKTGKAPMNFWIAVSDWAVNNFSAKVGTWQQSRNIKDVPPED